MSIFLVTKFVFFGNNFSTICGSGDLNEMKSKTLENYKTEEGNTVKLYTFLANLTKRIANDNKLGIDIDYRKVAFTAHKIFNSIACNATIAFQYLQQILNKGMPPQEVAQKLNDEIVKSMLPFFK